MTSPYEEFCNSTKRSKEWNTDTFKIKKIKIMYPDLIKYSLKTSYVKENLTPHSYLSVFKVQVFRGWFIHSRTLWELVIK